MKISEIRIVRMLEEAEDLCQSLESFRTLNEQHDEGAKLWQEMFWSMQSISLKLKRFIDDAPRKCGDFELVGAFEELESSSQSVTEPEEPEESKPPVGDRMIQSQGELPSTG